MKNIECIFEKSPPARRAKIEDRARELIGQEMALQQLRPIEPGTLASSGVATRRDHNRQAEVRGEIEPRAA